MGCVVTRPPEATFPNAKKKGFSRVYHSPANSSTDLSQRLGVDQQANQTGTSPSQSQLQDTSLKRTHTLKSHRSLSKNKDPFPKLRLPSNSPSLQDFSIKGSLDASFDPDKDKDCFPPEEIVVTRTETAQFRMRGSTPSFSKPSGFKANTPSLNTNPESVPRDRDSNNAWSLAPLKDSHVSPSESSEIKDKKSYRSEKTLSEEKKPQTKENTDFTATIPRVESMEIETYSKKDLNNDPNKKRNSAEMVENASGIKIRNIHHKFQRILLNDSTPTTPSNKIPTTNVIQLASPDIKSPIQNNVFNYHLPDGSPPKTLNFLDVPFANDSCTKKSLDFPDQTLLSASTTNIYSIGTISNLVSLCKGRDGKRKGETFERKFRTNLVDLIKDNSITKTREETPKVEITNIEFSKIASSEKENPIGSINKDLKDPHRPSIEKSVVTNSLTKTTLSNNLLSLVKDDQPKKIRSHHKHKSMQIHHIGKEDIFEDMINPSPLHKGENFLGNSNKYHLPPLPWAGNLNSSILKNSDSVFLNDKTIINFEEQASRIDWDKYSICEQVNNVEIDDRSFNHSALDVGSLTRLEGETQTPINLNTSVNNTDILDPKNPDMLLTKTKSVPNGKFDDGVDLSQSKNFPVIINKNVANLNESISTIQYLSPIQGPRTQAIQPSVRVNKRAISYSRAESQVIETNRVDKSVDEDGQKKVNQYILIKEVGRGGFGKVKLGINADTKKQYAIKIANKKKMKRKLLTRTRSAYNQLASEIAIMKKIDHPNIVHLEEIIDDPNNDKLYIVMEYVKRGAVMSKNYWRQEKTPGEYVGKFRCLSEEKAKKYFRHLILSLDYLHNCAEIIHRDIKPENLLISENDILKVSDFGISHIAEQGDDMIDNNAGTKYYLAPEAWGEKAFHGKPTDIWAAGGTLFYFLVGKPPFDAKDAEELKNKVQDEELKFDGLNLNPKVVNLIQSCLIKDPFQRITLEEIMQDPWLTDDGTNPLTNEEYTKLEATEQEMDLAFSKIKFLAVVKLKAKLKKNLTITRRNLERKKTQEVSQMMMDK